MSEASDPLEAELSAVRPNEISPELRRRIAQRLNDILPEDLLEAPQSPQAPLPGDGPMSDAHQNNSIQPPAADPVTTPPPDAAASPIVHLDTSVFEGDAQTPSSAEVAPGQPRRLGRYEVHEEIARGGMGSVLRVRDAALNRDLAVKVLRPELRHSPMLVRRFVQEAQITAQLPHPAIVPVIELGHDDNGLPFLAMKLVRGDTLASLLQGRTSPQQELPRFVGIFEQVCQAVAFAHSRHVIHRDLKPDNVMVGRFGEVQVMDWGLAKVLPKEQEPLRAEAIAAVSEVQTQRRSEEGALTEGALGTWCYMPPEQANGELADVDVRADVFSLGGILCVILTGQPPYVGREGEIKRKAQRGDVGEALARLDGCGADSELVMLTKECLSPELATRPRDAGEVARRVALYQAGVQERLRQAEQERAAAEARAEEAKVTARAERRARRRTVALVSVVTVALLGGGTAAAWYFQEQAARRARAEADAGAALTEARTWLDQEADQERRDPERWAATVSLADGALQRAEAAVASAVVKDDLRERARALREQVAPKLKESRLRVELDKVRLDRAAVKEGRFDDAAAVSGYRAALGGYGIDLSDTQGAGALVRDSRLRPELLAALEDWQRVTTDPRERRQLGEVLEAAEPEPGSMRRQWRAAVRRKDGGTLAELALAAAGLAAADLVNLAADLQRLGQGAAAERLLRQGQRRFANDYWVNRELGLVLLNQGVAQEEEAVRYLTAAAALRSQSSRALLNLGAALYRQGKVAEAVEEYHKAIALDPKFAVLHDNLGIALKEQGKVAEAVEEYKKAIALDPKFAGPHNNLGNALQAQGKVTDAVEEYKQAIALDPKYAGAHDNLGNILKEQGKVAEAVEEYKKAIALDPKVANPHNNLGNALREQGKLAEAVEEYKKAIALDPKHAGAHTGLGKALRTQGKVTDAVEEYKKAIAFDPKLAMPHNGLGNCMMDQGKLAAAAEEYKKAIALDPNLAFPHNGLGNAFKEQGRLAAAVEEYKKAIALDPKDALPHFGLGNCMLDQGKVAAAIDEYKKAITLDPKLAFPHNGLGNALQDQGKLAEAVEEFKMAIALDPKDAAPHHNLGIALKEQGKLAEAVEEYHKAIALGLKLAQPHNNLATVLEAQGKVAEAIEEYKKAITLDPKFAAPHHNLGLNLQDQGKVAEAVEEYRKAIALDPKGAKAYGVLGQALLQLGDFVEARQALRRCLQLLPPKGPQRDAFQQLLQRCEAALALNEKLPAVLRGDARPANAAEALALAQLCQQHKQLHVAAARFYADALQAEPKLAWDIQKGHRYNAACSASLAAAGQGKDAEKLEAKERQRLRRQALDWLRADLDRWGKRLAGASSKDKEAIRKVLEHWQEDTDLASIRDDKALSALPVEERTAWKKLWADVAALLDKLAAGR